MTNTYRAISADTSGTFTHTERPLHAPAPGHVMLRVEACGICHSDVAGIKNLMGHRSAGAPIVPGHEIIGRVDAVGDGVEGWAVGARSGSGYLGGHCGTCANCQRGEFTFCLDQPISGDSQDGGYAQYVLVRASGLVPVPEGVPATTLAPLMCAGRQMGHQPRGRTFRPSSATSACLGTSVSY